MGQRLRHYGALMKKNWIIWKRTLGASLCELFCPIALMAILAVARVLVEKTEIEARSNLSRAQLYYPLDHLHAANTTASTLAFRSNVEAFANFSNITFDTRNPAFNLFPTGC